MQGSFPLQELFEVLKHMQFWVSYSLASYAKTLFVAEPYPRISNHGVIEEGVRLPTPPSFGIAPWPLLGYRAVGLG